MKALTFPKCTRLFCSALGVLFHCVCQTLKLKMIDPAESDQNLLVGGTFSANIEGSSPLYVTLYISSSVTGNHFLEWSIVYNSLVCAASSTNPNKFNKNKMGMNMKELKRTSGSSRKSGWQILVINREEVLMKRQSIEFLAKGEKVCCSSTWDRSQS